MINDWNAFADERCTILKGDGNKGCVMSDDPGHTEVTLDENRHPF